VQYACVNKTGREWLSISYREFYDVPRAFFVRSKQGWLFFDCPFDADADDYRLDYEVGLLDEKGPEAFPDSWSEVRENSLRQLGTVRVAAVRFDDTRRAAVHAETLSLLGL
jgi:hypothetical protein